MAKNLNVVFEGDNSNFKQKAVETANMLDAIAQKAQGLNSGNAMSSLAAGFATASRAAGPLGMAVGTVGLAIGVAIDNTVGAVNELNRLSAQSRVSVETLQKLESAFKETGMSAEKFADLNKDFKDKMADGLLNNSSLEQDLNKYGLSLKKYVRHFTDPEGGVKAAIEVLHDLRAAGASDFDISFITESLGSDYDHLSGAILRNKDAQETWNNIQSQSVSVTNETAEKYKEFDKNITELTGHLKESAVDGLTPMVTKMNEMFDWFDKDWPNTSIYKALAQLRDEIKKTVDEANRVYKDEAGNTVNPRDGDKMFQKYRHIAHTFTPLQTEMAQKGYDPFNEEDLKAYTYLDKKTGLTMDGNGQAASRLPTASATIYDPDIDDLDWEAEMKAHQDRIKVSQLLNKKEDDDRKREEEKRKKAAEEKARKLDQARREQEAKDRALLQRKRQAMDELNRLDVKMFGNTSASIVSLNKQLSESIETLDENLKLGLISQTEYNERREALIAQNAANAHKAILGADPADALAALNQLKDIREQDLESLKTRYRNGLMSHQEYLSQKKAMEDAYSAQDGSLNGMGNSKFNDYLNGGGVNADADITGFGAAEYQKNQYEQQYRDELASINADKGKLPEEALQAKREAAHKKHNANLLRVEQQYNEARLKTGQMLYDGLESAMKLFGAENSAAHKIAFAAFKGFQLSNAIVAMNTAEALALADQTVPNTQTRMLNAKMARIQGMANVANIAASTLTGMAHEGIDNIPREGTWLLQKGERVVDDRTNGDLKDFLQDQKSGNGGSTSPIEVHAPLTIQGNVNSADKMVMDAIKRHAQFVAQAVEDAQRRKM
ncbi:hypothetical protein A4L30_10755 [Salmonella enterica subsp. enterica serovar Bovismorbificans]|nr:hypothetical protein [Salmonella enterica subsp. enterica serovar Bovismorbificans]